MIEDNMYLYKLNQVTASIKMLNKTIYQSSSYKAKNITVK